MKYVTAIAPMIGEISRLTFDNAQTQACLLVRPGEAAARLADILRRLEIGERESRELEIGKFHFLRRKLIVVK